VGRSRTEGPYADRIGPGGRLTIVSIGLPEGATIEALVGNHVPRPEAYDPRPDGHEDCTYHHATGVRILLSAGAYTVWQPAVLAGRTAYIRALCGQVDAVIADGPRVLIVGLETGRRLDGDIDALRTVLDGLDIGPPPTTEAGRLDPDAAVSFTSPLHGYRAAVSWRFDRLMANRPLSEAALVRGAAPDVRRDRIVDSGSRQLWIASTPVEPHVTAADVALSLPRRQAGSSGGLDGLTCPEDRETVRRVPPETWTLTSIGDVAAMERDSCYFIDVVAVVGGRAYLISARSPVRSDTSDGVRKYVDDFLATLEFLPAEAVDPE
jgi:hypothetical protein